MAVNIQKFIEQKIKEYDNEIDVSTGSVVKDILINPVTPILSDYVSVQETVLNLLSKKGNDSINTDLVEGLAATFLETRASGRKSTGAIRLYFQQPKAINIPKGSYIITEDGLNFITSTDYVMTKNQMASDISEYPYYVTNQIEVVAEKVGSAYNIKKGTVLRFTSSVTATPVKIEAYTDFTGGVDTETDDEFFARVVKSVKSNSLSSPVAIQDKIKSISPEVADVAVVGAKHPKMIRDLSQFVDLNANYRVEDFSFVYSGLHNDTYDKKHIALGGNFTDVNYDDGVDLPSITGWVNELSTDSYKGLWDKYDSNYAEQNQHVLIREFFGDLLGPADQQNLALVMASGLWQAHDGYNMSNSIFYIDEIGIDNKRLRLGKTLQNDNKNAMISLGLAQISGIWDMLQDPNEDVRTNGAMALRNIIAPESFNNMAPVFHTPISQHNGISIDVDVNTTDNTEFGEMSYITVLRNSEIFLPHDGYGIAWRKQPQFLIRINRNWTGTTKGVDGKDVPDSTFKEADIQTFKDHYDLDLDLNAVALGNYIKNNEIFWKYNVYLVDNDILQEEVWVGYDQMWDQTSGKNQFLQAGKAWIEPSTDYHFRIKIYSNMGTECWVHLKTENVNYDVVKPIIDRGQIYSKYVPQSGYKTTTIFGTEILDSSKGHFGLGIGETRNCEWYFDNLLIKSFVESFPAQLFRFKIDNAYFEADKPISVTYYGAGYDPVNYAIDGTGHSKATLAVYNTLRDVWETVGSNYATIDDSREAQLISGTIDPLMNYQDEEGYVNFAAYASNLGEEFPNDIEHAIRSYYIEVDNLKSDLVHRGNAVDIYCHDPNNIKRDTLDNVYMDANTVNLKSVNGLPPYIIEITNIYDSVGNELDKKDYSISTINKGEVFSSNPSRLVSFANEVAGSYLKFEYIYWANGAVVNSNINNSDDRYPAADVMIKAMPLSVVTINKLEYSGGLSTKEMLPKLVDYINSAGVTFDKSDLIDVLYDNGANYVNLDIEISIRAYDTDNSCVQYTVEGSTCSILPGIISRFYTDIEELNGVVQK